MKSKNFLFSLWLIVFAVAAFLTPVFAADAPAANVREWTRADGKKITAEYLGVLDQSVMLKLPNEKIIPCLLEKLSNADVVFIRENPLVYRSVWQSWPTPVAMRNVDVSELPAADGKFIYTTQHFRFNTDVNLGGVLMKDLARVFELTYDLQAKAPLGILATPDGQFYQAELFGTKKKYLESGGPLNTAGVYLINEKKFLAPLELMGLVKGSAGWRRISKADYDSSTIVHELTHMLTHDLLNNLPLWINEGYAEYISNIPIENGAFKTSNDAIQSGVIEALVKYAMTNTDIGYAAGGGSASQKKTKPDPRKMSFNLYPIAEMLTMADAEWSAPTQEVNGSTREPNPPPVSQNTMLQRYRTAHLILYYFIQIEGGQGVTKIRKFLDENRQYLAQYKQYEENFKAYQIALAQFKQLPGVRELPDKRIEYPSSLKPPQVPVPPFEDLNKIKNGGIKNLLGEDSAEIVGARIEEALKKNLGLNLSFTTKFK